MSRKFGGFSLVELIVGLGILTLLMVLLFGVINQTSSVVRQTTAQVDAYQQARSAFDLMGKALSQATLNTYWDYYDSANERRTPTNAATFRPKKYGRASDLQFLVTQNGHLGQKVFFTAPLAHSNND